MSRLVSLYPAPWRARYEDEFLAVLESRPLTLRDRLDVVAGALDARWHPQVHGPERIPDRIGYLSLAGFALFWAGIGVAATGPIRFDEYGSYRDGGTAVPFLLASVVLLSIGLARIVARLPSTARLTAVAGILAMIAGPVWAVAPWHFPVAMVFIVGLGCLAVGARSAGIMSTGAVVVLGLGVVVPLGLMSASLVVPWYALRTAEVSAVVLIAPLSLVWLVIARTLLHGSERTPVVSSV